MMDLVSKINEEIEITEMEIENLQRKLEILRLKKLRCLCPQDNRGDDTVTKARLSAADIVNVPTGTKVQSVLAVYRVKKEEPSDSKELTESNESSDSKSVNFLSGNPYIYYTIYTEPYQGIYSNEFEALRIIQDNPGIQYKKFKTGTEAQGSLALFNSKFKKAERNSFLQMLVNQPAEEASNLVPLGIKFRDPAQDNADKVITFQQWKLFANIIRKDDGGENYANNKYFSVERGNMSRYNLLPGITSKLCYQLFQTGLVENIYPSKDLKELDNFPKNFQTAIRNFQKRALKNSDRDVFLSIQSSLPWWEIDAFKSPYHFVRLGTKAKDQAYVQPRALEEFDFREEDLFEERAQGLRNVFYHTRGITRDRELRINYQTKKVIITSYFNQKISEQDWQKVKRFEEAFILNHLDVDDDTKRRYCKLVKNPKDKDKHICVYCVDTSRPAEIDTYEAMSSKEKLAQP